MFPYLIVLYHEHELQQKFFLDARRRERVVFADVSVKTSNHLVGEHKNTRQSVFFVDNEEDARSFLEFIARENPGTTWMMYTSMATATAKTMDVKLVVDKFDKNGKLP